jgi:16S rRNA (cytosine1402-N4)-methyltransferase
VPSFIHQAVLVEEVLAAMRVESSGRYIDATIGGGGHASAILRASSPTGWLYGFDQDAEAVEAARRRLSEFEGRFEIYRDNFANLAQWIEPESCHGVLMDLGVSSRQLDTAERGFSFQREGPLDMRMDDRQPTKASDLVKNLDETELAAIFFELGEEPQARRLARAIVRERQDRPLETTGQLARLIERLSPRHGKKRHPATRVFQALRMAVNQEAESLKRALAAACSLLKHEGRLVVITFHSIEDRIVKQFGNDQARAYVFEGERDVPELRHPRPPLMGWVERKPIRPGPEELQSNPRARSAKLRVLEKR